MQRKLAVLDLFSGIGGFSLGLESAGFKTIAFCEVDKFCQKVLSKHWPNIPISSDIKKLRYKGGRLYDAERVIYEGNIDLVCGGFPCQPFSIAGRKKGTEDNRDLWPEMFRLIQQAQPTWVIGENVPNFINMAFTRTKTDLEGEGYIVQPFIIPACAVGAPHRRDRVWIIAYRDSGTAQQAKNCKGVSKKKAASIQTQEQGGNAQAILDNRCATVSGTDAANPKSQQNRRGKQRKFQRHSTDAPDSDSDHQRCQGSKCKTLSRKQRKSWEFSGGYQEWRDGWPVSTPRVCGVDDGIPNRTHRLKSLGNAVVPQIPEIIGQAIINSIRKN